MKRTNILSTTTLILMLSLFLLTQESFAQIGGIGTPGDNNDVNDEAVSAPITSSIFVIISITFAVILGFIKILGKPKQMEQK